MKHRIQRPSLLLTVIAAVAVLAFGLFPAAAQVEPNTIGTFTGVPSTIATNGVATTNSSAITVPKGRAVAIIPEFALMSSGTGNVIFTGQVSIDGTNYTTVSGLTYTIAANGTTTQRGYWLLDPTELAAVRNFRLSSHSNAGNAVVLTNLVVRWSIATP